MPTSLYVWLGEPFAGVSPWALTGIVAIYFICFLARGAIGFGALAPVVTFTSWLLPPHHAVLLAVLAATIPQLQLLPGSLRRTDWQVARPVMLAIAITTVIGTWLFVKITGDTLTLILGAVITTVVLLDITKLLDRAVALIDIRAARWAFGLSSITGFVNGIAGAGGMIALVVYLKHACRDHETLRNTTIFLASILLCWRFLLTFASGMVSWTLLTEAALLLPIIYVGVWIGAHFTRHITAQRYYAILQSVLLVSAVGLLIEGLWRVL